MSKLYVGSSLYLLDTLVSSWTLFDGAASHVVCGVLLLSAVASLRLAAGWANVLFEGRA